MAAGFELTGVLPRSHVFISKFKPADQSGVQLRRGAKRLRDGLLAAVKPSPDPVVDKGVLEATRKEVQRGFVKGPVPPGEVPASASLTHRFGVIQGQPEDGPKVRPIDASLAPKSMPPSRRWKACLFIQSTLLRGCYVPGLTSGSVPGASLRDLPSAKHGICGRRTSSCPSRMHRAI